MNKRKKISVTLYKAFYITQLDYLLFSSPKELEQFKKENFNEDIFKILKLFLENNLNNNQYPKEAYDNLGKLLLYINELGINDNLKNDYNEIIQLYSKIANENSYEKIYEDYIDRFEKPLNTDNKAIYMKYYIECIKFDFLVIMYFIDFDKENNSENMFVFDEKFLYSINAIINKFPELLLDSEIKEKIINILSYPINNINSKEIFIEEFFIKNKTDDKERYYDYLKLSADLLLKVNSNKLENKFNKIDFETQYMTIFLEKYIIAGTKIDINYENTMLLESLYWLIDYYVQNGLVNTDMKYRIIYLLNQFKDSNNEKNREFIQKWNMYLIKLNTCEVNENKYLHYYQSIKLNNKERREMRNNYIETNDKSDIIEFLNTINFDFLVMQALLCEEQEFENNYKEMLACNEEFIYSLRRLYIECIDMFYSTEIFKRVNEVMELTIKLCKEDRIGNRTYYKNTKIMLKKIKNISQKR